MAYFDGQPAIVHRSGGQINVYYGGASPQTGMGMGMSRPPVAP